jgi:hypothetical protein
MGHGLYDQGEVHKITIPFASKLKGCAHMNIRKAQMESSKGSKVETQVKRTKDKKKSKGSYSLGKFFLKIFTMHLMTRNTTL